jgi:hypothetical protein
VKLRQLSTEAKAITGVALVESVKLKDRDDPSDVRYTIPVQVA